MAKMKISVLTTVGILFLNFDIVTTNIGFRDMKNIRKLATRTQSVYSYQDKVNHVFTSVAPVADKMNDLMSLGGHRLWKDWMISRLNPQPGMSILDACSGTGDLSLLCHDYLQYRIPATVEGKQNLPLTDIPLGKPLMTIGRHLDIFGLLKPVQRLSEKLPGSCFKHTNDTNLSTTSIDINPEMVERAVKKAVKNGFQILKEDEKNISLSRNNQILNLKTGDIVQLEEEEGSHDAYISSFGLRYVGDKETALSQAYNALRPGGRILILEFNDLNNVKSLYNATFGKYVPLIGEKVASKRDEYQFLSDSMIDFPETKIFQNMLKNAGFKNTSYENLTILSGPFTIVIHSAFK